VTDLATPLRSAVGGRTATPLEKHLGLRSVGDLVHHYPRRYARRGELTSLADLRVGEHVTVMAEVRKVSGRNMKERKGHVLEVEVTDGTGRLYLTFFNQKWRADRDLFVGRRGLFAGQVSVFKGKRQLTHPDYEMIGEAADADAYAGALIPIYPAATKYASWQIANAVRMVLPTLQPPPDPIPTDVRRRHDLLPLDDALHKIHQPASYDDVRQATSRLKWDEAFTLQVSLARRRAASRQQQAASWEVRDDGLLAAFDARLPFALTEGQQQVGDEIFADLAQPHPMHRLLQGEVGAGKTVVALRAMLAVVDGGGQTALLAPTEVLAQQHARSIRDLLGPLAMAGELGGAEVATRVALLTGSQGAAARRAALDEVADGTAGIVVGTHALLQEGVEFRDLGLLVVDEQHRFGVEQRDALRAKSTTPPHVLVMTATPIPRTVAMTVYGDLETSALTQLPQGRSEIQTTVVPVAEKPAWLDRVWQRVREEAEAGRQVFVVCPRIGDAPSTDDADAPAGPEDDEGPQRPTAAVTDVLPMLVDGPLAGLRVDALHGRLAPDAKDDVMRRFAGGDLDVLVATTVIEVGVDVPNATVMVVLDAERFGVSQLHQLRGRVGRGSHPGLCLLVTGSVQASPARTRLEHVAATTDGFELARLDLQERREGDVLGAVQHGRRSSLKLLALLEDEDLIRAARDEASALVDADPDLADHPVLAAAVERLVDDERAEYLEKT
jgi:ATP-dependent DNA helicase RecG